MAPALGRRQQRVFPFFFMRTGKTSGVTHSNSTDEKRPSEEKGDTDSKTFYVTFFEAGLPGSNRNLKT
jgi:hypothetical protein